MSRFKLFVLALAATLAVPVLVFAQDPNPKPDVKDAAAKAIAALTPILSVFVLWGFKALWEKVPASLVLIAGPVAGIVINYGLSYLSGLAPVDPIVAAALGAVSTWIREIGSTLVSKGLSGPITITKFNF